MYKKKLIIKLHFLLVLCPTFSSSLRGLYSVFFKCLINAETVKKTQQLVKTLIQNLIFKA